MPELCCNIPHFYCLARREFFRDQEDGHGEVIPVAVFGVTSLPTHALLFHVMTETGAKVDRLPIHALCWKAEAKRPALELVELWDCFSLNVVCIQWEYLRGMRCTAWLKDKSKVEAEYLMSFDWHGSSYADDPGEGGHKTGELLKLDDGNFALLPSNRIYPWREPSFITGPFERPDFKTNSHVWRCESSGERWITSPDNRHFYEADRLETSGRD